MSFKYDKILMNKNCEWQKNLLRSLHNQLTRQRSVTCQILEIYYSFFFSISFPFLLKVCITTSHLVLESSRTGASNFNPFIKKSRCCILTEFHFLGMELSDPFIALLISCIIFCLQKRLGGPNSTAFNHLDTASETTQDVWFYMKDNKWARIDGKVINQSGF